MGIPCTLQAQNLQCCLVGEASDESLEASCLTEALGGIGRCEGLWGLELHVQGVQWGMLGGLRVFSWGVFGSFFAPCFQTAFLDGMKASKGFWAQGLKFKGVGRLLPKGF